MTRVADLLNALPAMSRFAGNHWVAAMLAEAEALRTHDDSLYCSRDDPGDLAAARQLHQSWADWADEAEHLLTRLRPLQDAGERITGAEDLGYQIARTRAMLQITPEQMLRRQSLVDSAKVTSVEEVRRELRAANRG